MTSILIGVLTFGAVPTFGQTYDVTLEMSGYVAANTTKVTQVRGEPTVEGAFLRQDPDPTSKILQTLAFGESIEILSRVGNWYEVVLGDGTQGYMYKSQVGGENLNLVPEKEMPKSAPVEVINWSEASKVIPRGSVVTIEDVYTGKKFQIKRTFGTNHADVEALTKSDTQMIKQIWGGFTWERRPVIVHTKGRRLAASMSGMPHAGSTLDAVKGNGMSGVMDLHFRGSRKHKEGNISATTDPLHQQAISKAAQYKGK